MEGKPTSIKPSGTKRESRAPEPTGESSDSSRSRSLSAGRTSSRRLEAAKKSADVPSKWSLSQYVSSDEESDKDVASPVGKRTRFRRGKGTKAVAKEVTSQALSEFKIPKKSSKKFLKDLSFGQATAGTSKSQAADDRDDNLVVGASGKVLGYKTNCSLDSSRGYHSDQNTSMYAQTPTRSKVTKGTYLPVISVIHTDSAGSSGAGQDGLEKTKSRPSPYSKSKPKAQSSETLAGGDGSLVADPLANASFTLEPPGPSPPAKLLSDEDVDINDAEDEDDDAGEAIEVSPDFVPDSELDFEPEDEGDDAAGVEEIGGDKEEELDLKEEVEEKKEDNPDDPEDKDQTLTNSEGKNTDGSNLTSSSAGDTNAIKIEANNGSLRYVAALETAKASNVQSQTSDEVEGKEDSLIERGIFTQTENNVVSDLNPDSDDVAGKGVADHNATAESGLLSEGSLLEEGAKSPLPDPITPTVASPQQESPAKQEESASMEVTPKKEDQHQQPPPSQPFTPTSPLPGVIEELQGFEAWAKEIEKKDEQIMSTPAPTPVPPPANLATATPRHQDLGKGKKSGKFKLIDGKFKLIEETGGHVASSDLAKRNLNNEYKFQFKDSKNTKTDSQNEPSSPIAGPSTAKPGAGAAGDIVTSKSAAKDSAKSADGNAAGSGGTKPKRRNNPRPDLVDLDIPMEQDTRYLRQGYVYTTKEQYAIDREHVKAALQEARMGIAAKIFDTMDANSPTAALRRFWAKTGVAKTKTLNEIVAILLNATSSGWAQAYNKWCSTDEDSEAWHKQLEDLQQRAIKIFQAPQTKKDLKAKQDKEAKLKAETMKKGESLGINFSSLTRPSPAAQAADSKSKSDSNKSKRFDKVGKTDAPGASKAPSTKSSPPETATSAKGKDDGKATITQEALKSALKPASGLHAKSSGGKSVQFPPDSAKSSSTSSTSSTKPPAKKASEAGDKHRERDEATSTVPPPKPKSSIKNRLSKKLEVEVDYYLVDLLGEQKMTHKPTPTPQPLPSTPTQPNSDEEEAAGGDLVAATSGEATPADDDFLEVNASKDDLMFSPDRSGNAKKTGKAGKKPPHSNSKGTSVVIPKFNPNVPPPSYKPISQGSTSTNSQGEVRKRVIVESIGSDGGDGPQQLSVDDLRTFRARLETHIHEYNKFVGTKHPPARVMPPWLERGKIIVTPADENTGQLVVDLVNKHEIKIPGHKLVSGWNLNLPEVAVISIRYDLVSKRPAIVLIEDEHNGIARQNGWAVGPNEISYLNENPCDTHPTVTFVRAIVSRKVVDLIKATRGQIWISGGQATVMWNNKPLDASNNVKYNYQ